MCQLGSLGLLITQHPGRFPGGAPGSLGLLTRQDRREPNPSVLEPVMAIDDATWPDRRTEDNTNTRNHGHLAGHCQAGG